MPKKKPRKPPIPAIPQLSLKALGDVQTIEDYAKQELRECRDFTSRELNVEKVTRIIRTCAVSVLDSLLAYYESLPNFHDGWVIQLQESAIESVVGMIPSGYQDELYEFFGDVLWKTTYAHLNPPKVVTSKSGDSRKVEPITPKQLRDSYLSAFPNTKILDICWAAGQRYSEWKRWLRKAVKDNSAPDRAFRAVLASGKAPAEYRKEARPSGWK